MKKHGTTGKYKVNSNIGTYKKGEPPMKYRIYALALLLLHSCAHAEDISGKSVFVDFMNYDLYSTTGYTLITNQEHEKGHMVKKPELSVSIFGGKTTQSGQDDLRTYLLFDGLKELIVREDIPDNLTEELSQDILCRDFNVRTQGDSHHSKLTLNPKQTSLGFALSYRHPLSEKYWVSVDAPFLHLKQTPELKETILTEQTAANSVRSNADAFFNSDNSSDRLDAQENMLEAFRQPGLKYGRIDGTQKKNGMADLKIRIGRNAVNKDNLFVSQYLGLVIPTGNKRTAEYMWEPIVGNGHHAGIEWGNTIQMCMHEAKMCNWWVTNALTGHYLFENTQKRSLDLYNGQWTRYLAMFKDGAGRIANRRTFGINLMTQDVKVNPGFALGMASQVSLVGKNWNLNAGVINRVRQAEDVQLAQAWVEGPMIAHLDEPAGAPGEVAPLRKMGRDIASTDTITTTNTFIKTSDINLNSAAHPSVIMSTLHASAAYFNDGEFSQNYEIGGSYDTARQNAGINRWNVYGKVLISF